MIRIKVHGSPRLMRLIGSHLRLVVNNDDPVATDCEPARTKTPSGTAQTDEPKDTAVNTDDSGPPDELT